MSAEIGTEPTTDKLPTGDCASAYFSPLGVTLRAKASSRTFSESLSWPSKCRSARRDAGLALVGAGTLLRRVGGIDAPCECGVMTSGEHQRVGLTRAPLRRPQLLLRDEARNALDPDSERDIPTTPTGLSACPTIVIVAHQPETFASCGRAIRFSQQHLPLIEERDQAIYGMLA